MQGCVPLISQCNGKCPLLPSRSTVPHTTSKVLASTESSSTMLTFSTASEGPRLLNETNVNEVSETEKKPQVKGMIAKGHTACPWLIKLKVYTHTGTVTEMIQTKLI